MRGGGVGSGEAREGGRGRNKRGGEGGVGGGRLERRLVLTGKPHGNLVTAATVRYINPPGRAAERRRSTLSRGE